MKELIDFITIFGIVISIILIFLLVKEKKRGLDKNILIIIFSFILFTCLSGYADSHSLKGLLYISLLFDFNLFWILGPLMLLYVKSVFFDNKNLIRKNIYHFFPSILLTSFVELPLMLNMDFDYLRLILNNQLPLFLIRDVYFLFYIYISIRLFIKLKKTLNRKLNFSIEGYNWILKLLIGCSLFASIDTFMRIIESFGFGLGFDGGYITFAAIIIFLTYFGYYSINEAKLLVPSFIIETNEKSDYNFSDKEALIIEQKIKSILENEKMYLDETLSIKKLSESIEISEKKLSVFLNNHIKTRFTDYVNFYRVEAVKEKLRSEEYDNLTLLAISEECGFNSKASFYRIFKKHTGISPAQYKKNIK